MKLTEDYVRNFIEEVTPMVEEESQLECNIKNTGIKIYKNIFWPLFLGSGNLEKTIELYKHMNAFYNVYSDKIYLSKNKEHDEYTLLHILTHELTHLSQYKNFPDLINKQIDNPLNNYLISLIEGDAYMISDSIFPVISKNRDWKNDSASLGKRGEKILRQKFNDGKDRKSINELYTAPIEELVKIFGNQ